jgi:hypothetical protein
MSLMRDCAHAGLVANANRIASASDFINVSVNGAEVRLLVLLLRGQVMTRLSLASRGFIHGETDMVRLT